MDIASLIKYIIILVALLGVLVIFYLLPKLSLVKQEKWERDTQEEIPSLNHLSSIINNSRSTSEQLGAAIDLLIKHYGIMPSKTGVRPNPSVDIYKFLISRLCRHPNTNKDLVIKFTNTLEKLNPKYQKEINESLMEGLNSRGR